jgi:hypothetical protein
MHYLANMVLRSAVTAVAHPQKLETTHCDSVVVNSKVAGISSMYNIISDRDVAHFIIRTSGGNETISFDSSNYPAIKC